MNKREANVLHQELEVYREMGIPLYLNGKKSTPKRIEKAYRIAEEGVYMRDYIQDDTGKFVVDLINYQNTDLLACL